MTGFALDNRSNNNLKGVHKDLCRVILETAKVSPRRFVITEGVRSIERERQLIAEGKSSLKDPYKCRHVPLNGAGRAVDFVPFNDEGKISYADKDRKHFKEVAALIKKVALEQKVPVQWGGDWTSFVDMPHIELDRKVYP